MIHHIKRTTRHLVFWTLLALAVSLTGVRLALSGIEGYQLMLEARVSELVGAPVIIRYLGAKMRGFSPELILKDITIASIEANAPPAVQLKEIRLAINLFDMVLNRDLLSSSRVTLVGPKVTIVRKPDGSFSVLGLKAGDEQPLWLLQGSKFEVVQSEITWQDQKRQAKSLTFASVDLAIINEAEHHKVNLLMKLPEKYGDNLKIAMDLQGNAFEASTLNGAVYIEGKNLKLSELAELNLPIPLSVTSGVADIKVWTKLQAAELLAMTSEIKLKQVRLLHQNHDVLPIEQLKARVHWRLNENQWRLDVSQFLLETSDASGVTKWPDAVFNLAGNIKDDQYLRKLAVFISQLDLQEAALLAKFMAPLQDGQINTLEQMQLKGHLEQFAANADFDEKTLAINGKFVDLNVSPFAGYPGLSNITAQIQGNEKTGVMRLMIENAKLIAPDFLRESFDISSLKGNITWAQTETDWVLSSRLLALELNGLQSINRLSLLLPKSNALPYLDMQSSFVSDDISKLKHYLPVKVMKPADVIWYDLAFLSGRVTQGGLLYAGKLGVFPTKMEQGVFEASVDIDQLNLAYLPDWPQITNIAGKMDILQNFMTCEITQGQSSNLTITQATIINPELGTGKRLMVKGELEGEISDVFKFLKQTPLNTTVGFLVDAVVPQGNTQVELDLSLPLSEELQPIVYGSAQFNQARLNVSALDLWINKITGDLKFTELGVYSDGIRGVALGHPIKINIDKADHQQTFLDIKGSAGITDLQKQFKMPGWEIAQGEMDYQLKLGLPFPNSPTELVVQSDLVGVSLAMPGFLAKTTLEKKPLSLTFGLGGEEILPVILDYGDNLKAAVKVNLTEKKLDSGHILVGTGVVQQSTQPGLKLEINQDTLNLQEWLALSGHQNKDSDALKNIREIKIHSPHAQWKNSPLGAFDLMLTPEKNHWSGIIKSDVATGKLQIPVEVTGAEKINLTLSSIDLSALKTVESQTDSVKDKGAELKPELVPAELPLFSIASDNTYWRSVNLGQLSIETERIAHGMSLKHLNLAGKEQQLHLSGEWKIKGLHSETRLQGRLELSNAGQTLTQLAITKDLMDTNAVLDFTGNWYASPNDFSLQSLQGKVDVNLKNGRILSIEPGFGRLLGILAMAQWVKRLQLDFSDVFQQGLTFNSITGHFNLLNGKAITRDLVIDAIPAKINISGQTDFINKSLDQVVSVIPKSADAVPIAGTIMGKVTALIGRSLTGKDQEGFFFGSQYQVKGGWDDAQIIPLHENEGLLQKTWNGITGFPWVQQPKN
jgi:uncharacterized protein (TIGR02099 family)